MEHLDMLSISELAFKVVSILRSFQQNINKTEQNIKIQITGDIENTEIPQVPTIVGEYTLIFQRKDKKLKRYRIYGYRTAQTFKMNELEIIDGEFFKSYMYEDLNSTEAKARLIEIINRVTRAAM